jgi:hypothetical protein
VNDEFGRMWKEAVLSAFKVLSRNFHGETEEKREVPQSEIGNLRAEI